MLPLFLKLWYVVTACGYMHCMIWALDVPSLSCHSSINPTGPYTLGTMIMLGVLICGNWVVVHSPANTHHSILIAYFSSDCVAIDFFMYFLLETVRQGGEEMHVLWNCEALPRWMPAEPRGVVCTSVCLEDVNAFRAIIHTFLFTDLITAGWAFIMGHVFVAFWAFSAFFMTTLTRRVLGESKNATANTFLDSSYTLKFGDLDIFPISHGILDRFDGFGIATFPYYRFWSSTGLFHFHNTKS